MNRRLLHGTIGQLGKQPIQGGFAMTQQTTPLRFPLEKHLGHVNCMKVIKSNVNKTYPSHWHEFYEMEFVVAGEAEHVLNGVTYGVKKGSLYFMTPADLHKVSPQPGAPLTLYNVKFSENMLSDDLKNLLFSIEGQLAHDFAGDEFDGLHREFECLYEEAQCEGMGKEIVIRSGVERIIVALLRKCAATKRQQERVPSRDIHKALSYIHQHFNEPLSLDGLAKQFHMSANYFSELFHRETGFPFRHYLQHCRLQAAMSMTMSSDLPIIEICFASGFNSVPHFHRAFKQKYGQSPSALRKNKSAKLS
ncbi:MAG: AraC family transcriptional regulator [Paenibacillus sp.]|nr:AraC family transcriptional regulator [Paenibacillus sp.]